MACELGVEYGMPVRFRGAVLECCRDSVVEKGSAVEKSFCALVVESWWWARVGKGRGQRRRHKGQIALNLLLCRCHLSSQSSLCRPRTQTLQAHQDLSCPTRQFTPDFLQAHAKSWRLQSRSCVNRHVSAYTAWSLQSLPRVGPAHTSVMDGFQERGLDEDNFGGSSALAAVKAFDAFRKSPLTIGCVRKSV